MGDLDIWETNRPSLGQKSLCGQGWFVFDEVLSNGAVVASGVDLGEEVPVVGDTGAPGHGVLAALDSVAHPMVPHVDSF